MNKLRLLARGGAISIAVIGLWAFLAYGGSTSAYLRPAVVAVVLPTLPRGIAHAKRLLRDLADRYERRGSFSAERDSLFVSEERIRDRARVLAAVADAVAADGTFDDVRRDEFPEGQGLVVNHAGFHNSFVRLTADGRVAVTGASTKVARLAGLTARACEVSLERSATHPFRRAEPVRGAPRALLGVFLAVLLVVGGVNGVTAAAYPADAHGAAERAVLVGIDARADVDPGYSETEATLDKAAFLVDALREEAVEVSWERNASARLAGHGRQALFLSGEVRELLRESRTAAPARADRIEAGLHDAERRVAASLTDRLDSGRVEGDRESVRTARNRLRAAAQTPVRDDDPQD